MTFLRKYLFLGVEDFGLIIYDMILMKVVKLVSIQSEISAEKFQIN